MSATGSESSRHAFTKTLLECARADNSLFVVTSDARGSVTLTDFEKQLPDQFVETGIAEQNAAGISAGLGLSGKRVFLCGPACFYSARSVEQIKNDIAYGNADVKVVGVSGGVAYGALGSTHHSLHDIALYRAIPNMTIVLPADYASTVAATRALSVHPGPTYMRLGRSAVPDIYPSTPAPFELGRANVLAEGEDCAIIATGAAVYHAQRAAAEISEQGISCSVVDVHTIKPLDRETLLRVTTGKKLVVTVEEHSIYGGLGGAVAELLATHNPVPMLIIGFPDEFLPAGTSDELFDYAGINAPSIASRIKEALK